MNLTLDPILSLELFGVAALALIAWHFLTRPSRRAR